MADELKCLKCGSSNTEMEDLGDDDCRKMVLICKDCDETERLSYNCERLEDE